MDSRQKSERRSTCGMRRKKTDVDGRRRNFEKEIVLEKCEKMAKPPDRSRVDHGRDGWTGKTTEEYRDRGAQTARL